MFFYLSFINVRFILYIIIDAASVTVQHAGSLCSRNLQKFTVTCANTELSAPVI